MIDFNSKKIDIELKFLNSERNKRLNFIKDNINQYINKNYDNEFYELVYGDWLDNISNVSHLVWIDNINHDIEFKKKVLNIPFNTHDFNLLRGRKIFNSELYFVKSKTLNFKKLHFEVFSEPKKKKLSIKFFFLNQLKFLINLFSKKKFFLHSTYFFGDFRNYFFKILQDNKIYFLTKKLEHI